MAIDENQVEKIVRGVVDSLFSGSSAGPLNASSALAADGLFDNISDAIAAAKQAQKKFEDMGKNIRYKVIESIRSASMADSDRLAKMAAEETEMGRYEDKILKNEVAALRTPGPEDLEVKSYSDNDGTVTIERAPFGVVGAINPMTNPTACVINTAIILLSAGNSIVYLPHPKAHKCTIETIKMIHKAIVDAGAPANLVTAARDSKIENVSKVFKHEDISMISAVGGPQIVKLSMKSGKKVIGAGPGNPPVIVDDTADIANAAKSIMEGGSFDNNILCNEEKVIICIRSVLDRLLSEFPKNNTVVLNQDQAQKVLSLVVKDGDINKSYMGKNASRILGDAGINVDPATRLAVFVADSESNPMVQHEQLMPVLPILAVDTFDQAVATACRVEHDFKHTAMIHSNDINRITQYAREINTSILIVNGPSTSVGVVNEKGGTAWTIAGATGEGSTTPRSFTRERRVITNNALNFVK